MTKWFLISEKTVEMVKDTFQRFIENIEYYTKEGRFSEPEAYSKWVRERLHDFETNLHITEKEG